MTDAIDDFMSGAGLTLKELSVKHDVAFHTLQARITLKLKERNATKINIESGEVPDGGSREIFPNWKGH